MKTRLVLASVGIMSSLALGNQLESQPAIERQDLIQEYVDSVWESGEEAAAEEEDLDEGMVLYAQAEDAAKTADPAATAPSTTTTPPVSDAAPADGAAKPIKKVVKKKKKKKSATDPAADAAAQAGVTTGHGLQETGLPYKANVDLSLSYMNKSQTLKYSDKSYKQSSSDIDLDLKYLFILGRFEVGPLISFSSGSMKNDQGEGVSTTVTSSGMGFGLAANINFGNIHQDTFVPYAGLDFTRNSITEKTKQTGGSEAKESTTEMAIGLEAGGRYFMGGHIALKPFLNFGMIMSGENKSDNGDGTGEKVASVSGTKLSIGLGLAKYF
jgi:hypothetical protein